MAAHFTLAVGVNRYPNFPDNKQLRFANRDAEAFASWAESQGGSISILVSLEDERVQPVKDHVDDALVTLIQKTNSHLNDLLPPEKAQAKEQPPLFLFFSGHGLAPTGNDVLVLMANATTRHYGRNVATKAYLELLRTMGLWRQVWLFADCCREQQGSAVAGTPGLSVTNQPSGDQVLTNQFFAVPHGDQAYEPNGPNPSLIAQHGLFSRALLEGLWGAGAHPVTGQITGDHLREWVEHRLLHLSDNAQMLQTTIEGRQLVLGEVSSRLGHGDSQSLDLRNDFVEAMLVRLGSARLNDHATLRGVVETARAACLGDFDPGRNGNPFLPQDGSAGPSVDAWLIFPPTFQGPVTLLDVALQPVDHHIVVAGEPWALSIPEGLYEIEPFQNFQIRPGHTNVLLQAP